VGYSDAYWVESPSDRRSTSRYYVFIWDNLISWKSKKQTLVARSSVEEEYRTRTRAFVIYELIWLKQLLKELRIGITKLLNQMTFIFDNQAALHISSNSVFNEKSKHIKVDCQKR